MANKAAIIGGGVIGGGWAARFLLNGWTVRVYDPDPRAEEKINEVMFNARRSMPGLYDEKLPLEGELIFCDTVAEAVADADWIQESVPERLELKQAVYPQIQAAAPASAVIGSSTSGFKPSELAAGALRPEQIIVTHPYNPVYLLPIIEVVPHPGTDPAITARAQKLLISVGMKPIVIRKEIEAHVGDRLLESVWREALWMIKDDVATTSEIDDIMRFGFGIRWAQMGLFETYRVAGGEAGMAHFIAQFGPTLKWPWSKLMDVPELDEELTNKIASQSDAQSGHHSIRELERIRDNNLVAMMRALKKQGWGAGETLLEHDVTLSDAQAEIDWSKPVATLHRAVPIDWTDYNGHMSEIYYLEAFSRATDRLMEMIGCDADYIATGGSYFTAETHIRHIDETHAGATIHANTQMIVGAGKKLHLFHSLYEGDRLLATGEHFLLHVALETRKTAPPGPAVAALLETAMAGQSQLPFPEGAGKV
ncbi:MAG: carnitine 3-dehydrogenase [Halieaceae bacterium]|jgi:carnitine 3-dehydrogenase